MGLFFSVMSLLIAKKSTQAVQLSQAAEHDASVLYLDGH